MSSTKFTHDIDLVTIRQVVDSVQSVVSRFYGPQCTQTLLTSHTGQAVITSDGLTILDSLQPAHPVAVLVTTAIRSCLRHTQDGCKVFLIYLSSVLKNLEFLISNGKLCHSGSNQAAHKTLLNQQGAIVAAHCLAKLNQEVLPCLYTKLYSHSMKLYINVSPTKSRVELLTDVCKTTLAPHYNPKLCEYFSELVQRFIFMRETDFNLYKCLRFSLDHYGVLCIKVPNRPYSECNVLPMILIRRDFAVKCDQLLTGKPGIVLMLNTGLDVSQNDEDPVTFNVKNESSLLAMIQQQRHKAVDFVNSCADKQVNLILSTNAVPTYILNMLRQKNISVVTNVEKEDIDILEQLTGKYAISSHDEIGSNNLVPTAGVSRFGLGGQVYIHVKIEPLHPVNHLIVSAPTVGLCDQAAMSLQKAIHSILMCLNEANIDLSCYGHSLKSSLIGSYDQKADCSRSVEEISVKGLTQLNGQKWKQIEDSPDQSMFINSPCPDKQFPELIVIEGGGGFEMFLSKLLADYGKTCLETNMSLISVILSDSLVNVSRVLYDNVAITSSNRGFLEVKRKLEDHIDKGAVWGLNRRGKPCDMALCGVIEPLQSKIHVISCVLRLVEQLLKTDKVVSVQKLAHNVDLK